jgi:UDPglucose--hexose-1-phosphate uridylyltransferase
MPMDNATIKFSFDCGDSNVFARVINWPMPTLRFTSTDRAALTNLGEHVYNVWRNYNDKDCNIVSHTDNVEHNTITPITRLTPDGKYELDVVLRNNLTSEELPLGIYHPHPDKHHIKRENIGLIEVMGLFILPGRLKTELDEIAQKWADKLPLENDNIHLEWFNSFKNDIVPSTKQEALDFIYSQVGLVCENVLRDAGVYKEDVCGQEGLKRFLLACGFKL